MKQTYMVTVLLVGLISGTSHAADNKVLLFAGVAGALGSYAQSWLSSDVADRLHALEEAVHGKSQEPDKVQEPSKAQDDQSSILARLANLEKHVVGDDANNPGLKQHFALLEKNLHVLIGVVHGKNQGESEGQGGKVQEDKSSILARLAELDNQYTKLAKAIFPAHDAKGQDISLLGRVKTQITALEEHIAKLGHGAASASHDQPESEKGKQGEDFDPRIIQGEEKIKALDEKCSDLEEKHKELQRVIEDQHIKLSRFFSNPFKKSKKKGSSISSGSESNSEAHMTFESMESLVKEHEQTIAQLVSRIAALEGQCQAPKEDQKDVADGKSESSAKVITLPLSGQVGQASELSHSKKRKKEVLPRDETGNSDAKREASHNDNSTSVSH